MRHNRKKRTPQARHTFIRAARLGNVKLLKRYLKNPFVNGGSYGNQPLCQAAGAGHLETVKLLIDNGADLKDKRVLQSAAKKGQQNVVFYLVEHGADVKSLSEPLRIKFAAAIKQQESLKAVEQKKLKDAQREQRQHNLRSFLKQNKKS